MYDTRSTTGNNVRNILLMLKKYNLEEINNACLENFQYNPIPIDDEWRIYLAREIVDI